VSEQLSDVRLSSVEASGLSLAGLAPTMAMALGTAFAASEAGPAVPFSYLLAMIGSFSLAYVIVRYARRYDVSSGVAFTYAGRSLGRLAGFLAGWVYVTAWLSGTAVVLAIASVSTQALLARHGANISWFWIFLVLLLIVTAVNYLGVRPSVRLLVALELLSMLTLAGVMIHVLAVGGAGGLSWKPFDPSLSPKGLSGIGYGMIYGFAGFAGFEAAAALGRDSRDPGRVIPRAIVFSLVAAALFFILVTYSLSIGYGVNHAATWASDGAPLDTITGRYSGSTWAQIIDAMVAVSAFSSGLGLMALTSRVLFDIGSHGQAPEVFSRRHSRFATPYVGIAFAAAVALLLALTVGETTDVTTMIGVLAGANTLGLILIYAVLVIGSLVDRHERAWAAAAGTAVRATSVLVPLLALALLGYAFYASLFPRPPFPYSLEPYLVAAGVVLALVGAWILKVRGTGFDFVRAASEVEDIPAVDVAHVGDAPN
jgi:amino acid transporter